MAQARHGVYVLGEAPTDLEDNFAGQRLLVDEAEARGLTPRLEYEDWLVTVVIDGKASKLADLLRWADTMGVWPSLEVDTEEERRVAVATIGRTAFVELREENNE